MGQKTGSAPSRGVNRNRNEKGVTLVIGTLSMLFIIPMMGLAIDVGFLYAVKSKLQASVDGAALASARALSIGSSLSSQTTTAQAHAVTWFNSNFPSGYFGTYNTIMGTNNVNVYSGTGPQAQVRNVTVSAQTTVDTFFMKWVGFGSTTIAANGNASRRTVVAMLVLDRSGSMCAGSGNTNACAGTGNTYPCRWRWFRRPRLLSANLPRAAITLGWSRSATVHTFIPHRFRISVICAWLYERLRKRHGRARYDRLLWRYQHGHRNVGRLSTAVPDEPAGRDERADARNRRFAQHADHELLGCDQLPLSRAFPELERVCKDGDDHAENDGAGRVSVLRLQVPHLDRVR